MPKGILVLIPTGSNKTYFHKQLSKENKKYWIDGEKLLKKAGIKNKLQYWYDDEYEEIINKIKKIFNQINKKGINIFFSGNPLKLNPELIIFTDMTDRWNTHKRNKLESKWSPSEGLFTLENQSYVEAIQKTPIVINGDIPNIKTLKSLKLHINFNEKTNHNIMTK